MDSLSISLPDNLKEYVESRVAEGGYETASDYVRELVQEDQRRRAQHRLEALLIEGLESGPATEMTPADWAHIRARVGERLGSRFDP